MDFKSLVNRLDQLSEATKETPTGKVHKADQGGYGRKNYEDDKKKEKVAEPAVKRGRGRPRKDADSETGEVKKFDTSALSGHFGGKLPGDASKSGRTVSKMASAEKAVSAYNKMREKDKSHAEALRDAAEKYGISQSTLNRYIEDEKLDEVAPPGAKAEKASKKTKLKDWIDYIDENMLAENEQITVQPAKPGTFQDIKQGSETLATVKDPRLAQQIKQSIGKGEMSLAGSELGEDAIDDANIARKKMNMPASQRKAQGGNWKVSQQDLEKLPAGTRTTNQGLAAHAKRQGLGEEDMDEGKFVKAAGGVPSDRHGNPKIENPPKDVSVASLKQLEKNKRENPSQSPFRTQDEKVKKYLGLEEQGVDEGKEDYSAKKARAGQDIGKPGKQFAKIAKTAGEKYGSEEKGKKVAGAVLKNLRSKTNEADIPSDQMDMGAGLGAGRSQTRLESKKAKPDYIDLDKDGNKKESMKKAAQDKKKKVTESSHRHSAAKLLGKSHALAKEGYNCRFEDMDEAKMYHEGYKEGLDECYGQGVYEMAAMPASVPAMANAAMPSMEEDMFDEAMFDEGNAFTGALAKTPKGGKFSLGGKTFTDTSDLDEMSLAFESLDKQLKSLLESEEVSEGMTVSISKGQQGAPDSVSVTAQDAEADQLLGLIKHAGLGLFGDDQQSGYGATDSVAQDHGDIKVVGDHDGMMSIMKKISGIEDSSNDYEDEESIETDSEEVCDTCHESECQCETEEPIQEVETEDQMAFNVSEDDSEEKETTADEDAEAEEDKALAMQNSEDDEEEEEKVDESYANSDDDTFEADINFMTKAISGGLNKQKSTGQTTIPVIPGQNDRMGYSTNESIGDWKKLAGIK